MTPEQKQLRIEQIQSGDQEWRKTAYELGDVMAGHESDVDFLLSLVKEQEAVYVCEKCGRSDEHTPECPTAAWCPGCGSRVIGHQWNTCHDAIILTRSACAEKVRRKARQSETTGFHITDREAKAKLHIEANVLYEAAKELETLSIEQPKE